MKGPMITCPRSVGIGEAGQLMVEDVPCPICEATGEVRDFYDTPEMGVIGWLAVVGALLVIGIIVAAILLSRDAEPRSATDPTTARAGMGGTTAGAGDPSLPPPGASGPWSSGAPRPSPAVAAGHRGRSSGSMDAGPEPMPELDQAVIGSHLLGGVLNQAKRSHGDHYLAIRAPRGTRVRVCGEAKCVVMSSTDYGPQAGTGKIADVALVVWREVCGLPDSRGVCDGEIEWPYRGSGPTLPPTDADPSPVAYGTVEVGPTTGERWAWAVLLAVLAIPAWHLLYQRPRKVARRDEEA